MYEYIPEPSNVLVPISLVMKPVKTLGVKFVEPEGTYKLAGD